MNKFYNSEIEKSVRTVQNKLSAIEQLVKKSAESDQLLSQISIASMLKTEMSYCYADRRLPILCALKTDPLSDGKSMIVFSLMNRSGYELTDWLVILDLIPFQGERSTQLSDSLKPKIVSSMVHRLPSIKNGSSAQISIFSVDNFSDMTLINCYLTKKFPNVKAKDEYCSKNDRIFQILIEKFIVTILDHVNFKSNPTFVPPNFNSDGDRSDEQDRFFVNFHISFLRLIGKDRIVENFESLCKIVLGWLFPHLTVQMESSTIQVLHNDMPSLFFDSLSVSCAADLCLQFQNVKPSEVRLNFVVTGKFSRELSRSLKKAVISKYLMMIEDFLNVPTSVELDIQDIRTSLEYMKLNSYMDDSSDSSLKYLLNTVLANMERLANKKAFIVGYTGEVGKQLVKELLENKVFSKVILLGRRTFDLPQVEAYLKAVKNISTQKPHTEQIKIDFDNIEKCGEYFKDCEFGFCCLGTTRAKSGADGFVKVDHDYVVNTAKVAAENGCQHFSIVSSAGADKNSFFLYPKTKGLMEEDVSKLPFTSVSIFHPKLLLADRQENRLMERAATLMLTPITKLAPTVISVPTLSVAKAMIFRATECAKEESSMANKVEIIDNKTIHQMAASWDDIPKH